MNTEIKRNKVNPNQVRANDLMAFVYFAKVKNVGFGQLNVTNVDTKQDFGVNGNDLIEDSYSADRYSEEVKVTKTQAAEILVSSYNVPLKVTFEKADGTKRTLRGRLVTPEPLLGRSMCEDLDITVGNNLRQVDHRTISEIITKGVRYVVKS